MMGLNFGICLPKTCSQKQIERVLTKMQKIMLKNKVILSILPETCQIKDDLGWNLDAIDYICL